jgi:hypothetical protein
MDQWQVVKLSGAAGPYAIRMPYPKDRDKGWLGIRNVPFKPLAEQVAMLPAFVDVLSKIECHSPNGENPNEHAMQEAITQAGELLQEYGKKMANMAE